MSKIRRGGHSAEGEPLSAGRVEYLEAARAREASEEELGHASNRQPGDELVATDLLPLKERVAHGGPRCATLPPTDMGTPRC